MERQKRVKRRQTKSLLTRVLRTLNNTVMKSSLLATTIILVYVCDLVGSGMEYRTQVATLPRRIIATESCWPIR